MYKVQGLGPWRVWAEPSLAYFMAASSSLSFGNAPLWRLDHRSAPSTVTSNTPPPDLRRVIVASGRRVAIRVRAARARAS